MYSDSPYSARPGSRLSNKDAIKVASYLGDKLFPNGESYDPEMIVEDARNPKSPLHKHFDWDDSTAAHAYRLEQAKRLIVRIQVTTPEGYNYPLVISTKIKDSPNREYRLTEEAIKNPVTCKDIMIQAIEGLVQWKRRFNMFARLPEFQPIMKDIEKLAKARMSDVDSEPCKRQGAEGPKRKQFIKPAKTTKSTRRRPEPRVNA